jgi:hypothetical protein
MRPDVVVADISMPSLNGIEAAFGGSEISKGHCGRSQYFPVLRGFPQIPHHGGHWGANHRRVDALCHRARNRPAFLVSFCPLEASRNFLVKNQCQPAFQGYRATVSSAGDWDKQFTY